MNSFFNLLSYFLLSFVEPYNNLVIAALLLLLFLNIFNATNSSLQSGFKGINLNMQVMTCSSVAILLHVTDYIIILSDCLLFTHFPFSLCLFFSGKQRICLIILNQPLDKDHLHILWSKGTFLTHHKYRSDNRQAPFTALISHLHWFAPNMYSPVVFCHTVLSSLCSLHSAISLPHSLPFPFPFCFLHWYHFIYFFDYFFSWIS